MTGAPAGYGKHWDDKFRSRPWGKYPPEELVRFMGRQFRNVDPATVSVLEVGCGPGANLWFLHREGFRVAGIDISETAIAKAAQRLEVENAGLNASKPDLRQGDFSSLPWPDQQFDVVIDIHAIYANPLSIIRQSLGEVHRVLRPGGHLFAKLWGRKTTGYGTGVTIEAGTYDDIPSGPCAGMGISHFFDRQEIGELYQRFEVSMIDVIHRTDGLISAEIEEFVCHFRK